jgi:hypothetical protein
MLWLEIGRGKDQTLLLPLESRLNSLLFRRRYVFHSVVEFILTRLVAFCRWPIHLCKICRLPAHLLQLIVNPQLNGEDSFQIASMGVQGLRVEIASDGPPPPDEAP